MHGLFVAALAGDAQAYEEFLSTLASHLRAFFRRRLTRFPDDVEDLVQDCLLAIHQGRHTFRPEQPLTAWVHTIARYKLVDLLRARSRREALHDPLDDELAIFAESDTEASDARRDLAAVLASVPERQRRVLVMMKVDGASVAEVAQATGMSPSAVKVSVHRTLKALAARLKGSA
ncbi:MAG TPA: sigma-70 family RNA polymerase sigma factor [Ramlibacter sp.]